MGGNPQIENWFKKESDGLRVNPSSKAWERLEGRLDHKKHHQNRRFRRMLGMAATLLLVLSGTFILTWYINNFHFTQSYYTASLTYLDESQFQVPPVAKFANLRAYYNAPMNEQPILAEARTSKRHVPVNVAPQKDLRKANTVHSTPIPEETPRSKASTNQDRNTPAIASKDNIAENGSMEVQEPALTIIADQLADNDMGAGLAFDNQNSKAKISNALNSHAGNSNAFNWILGEWKTGDSSFEKWTQNEDKLIGEAYLKNQEGKQIVTEKIIVNLNDSSGMLIMNNATGVETHDLTIQKFMNGELSLQSKDSLEVFNLNISQLKSGEKLQLQNVLIKPNKAFDQRFMQNARQRNFMNSNTAIRKLNKVKK